MNREPPLSIMLITFLAIALVAAVACSGASDTVSSAKDRVTGEDKIGVAERGARRFKDGDLSNMLLPRGAVPAGLTPSESFLLPNDVVAALLLDRAKALSAMEKFGRVQGAGIEFRGPSRPAASQTAIAVGSTVSWYATIGGAESVVADPTMELALQGFGLDTAEIQGERVGQQSRTFRGFRDGDAPDHAAYVVLYRRDNLIGVVVVVMPALSDDGGRLASILARRQATLPLPAAP